MTYKIVIPGKLPGLNEMIDANRTNRYKGAQQKKDAEFLIKLIARNLPELEPPIDLVYTWYAPDKRRDKDNIAAAQKFVQDSLVSLGKIRNDGWDNIGGFMHQFRIDKANPRVEVLIIDQREET